MSDKHSGYPQEGIYRSRHSNRNVTIVGTKRNPSRYINRSSVGNKKGGLRQMGMTHYGKTQENAAKNPSLNLTCYEHLYNVATNQ